MCEGKAGLRGAACGGGDTGDDFAGDTGFARRIEFLAAAAEDEGIAAFQAHDLLAGERLAHQQFVDQLLLHRVAAALLRDRNPLDMRRNQREHAFANEPVVDHEIGAFEQARGA